MTIGFDASRAFGTQRTGTENYSYELLRHLVQLSSAHTYTLYIRGVTAPQNEVFKSDRVTAKYILNKKLWTQLGLAWELLQREPDVLFIPAHTLPVIHRPSLKSVVTIHDLGAEYLPQYHQFPQKLYLNRATEYAVRHATHLIAVSEATKCDLIGRLGANPDKITVVYEGFTSERFNRTSESAITAVKQKHGLIGPYFLFVGTIQPRKNLERLIAAFAQVITQITNAENMREYDNITLVLAGKKGWLSEPIYQAPQANGIAERVKFLDYVPDEDMPALFSGAAAFVFPSLFEGFGVPVLEALSCQTPVVTSSSASLPEVGGEAVLYADPNDTADIAHKMYTLLSDQNICAALAHKAPAQLAKFSWQKTAQETLEVFERVYGA